MTPVTSEVPGASTGTARVTIEILEIGGALAEEVKAASGASPMNCSQCAKCSSGCPVADRGDLKPHELVRLVQTDQRGSVLASRFIWECTSCHTCITRCPQKVDIPAMNDALRALSLSEGMAVAGTAVPVFNEAFLNNVRKRGRIHELGLMATFKLRSRRLWDDIDKAPSMLSKGKLPLRGSRVGGRSEREELFRRAVSEAAAGQAAGERAGAEDGVASRDEAAAPEDGDS
jgi:heterodisulfide reductase subunit C